MSNRIPEDQRARAERAAEAKAKLTAHRGLATWGEKRVPLATFERAVDARGRALDDDARKREIARYRRPRATPDPTPVEGPYRRIAVLGGVYSNRFGLAAALDDARRRGAEAVYCLGDLGGFGPEPERIWPLLQAHAVRTIQGNYEQSLASGRDDCNCGYADPRDNHYAEISYRYTAAHSSSAFKAWMGALPTRRRVRVGGRELLLVHGSPRRVNEFLFGSTTPDAFLEVLLEQEACDGILCTHTGLQWHRRLPSGGDVVNVGVIGRPANDGRTNVWYTLLSAGRDGDLLGGDDALEVELVPLAYDHAALAADMRRAELPEPFVETVLTGWWTTCLEILPARERAAGRF